MREPRKAGDAKEQLISKGDLDNMRDETKGDGARSCPSPGRSSAPRARDSSWNQENQE
jgi:hypothetical protein